MSGKFFIYIIVGFIVIWSLDSVNINSIFKKNRPVQSTFFYMVIALSLIYLVSNFVYDFFISFY